MFTLAVLSTQMFPGILFLLPLFLIFVSIGNATGITLLGSRTGLVITYLTFSLPFSIWLLAAISTRFRAVSTKRPRSTAAARCARCSA